MLKYLVSYLLFAAAILSFDACIVTHASAQWSNTANDLLGPVSNDSYGGAMTYRDGNLWVGWESLYLSQDQGLTFSKMPLMLTSEFIIDISFFDRNTGVVVTSSAVYITHDQGATWSPILSQASYWSCDFMGSANDIIVAGAGPVYTSRDGGLSWVTHNIGGSAVQGIARRGSHPIPGKAYVMTTSNPGMFIHTTTDYGATWVSTANSTLSDTYSFATDSCDENSFYVANEGAYAFLAKLSIIWVTHDNGNSWQQGIQNPRKYFEGSIATGLLAIYAPSIANGVWRSTDGGTTWTSIGGPGIRPDTHLLSAITDNLLVTVDSNGSIWRTTNSGGDSVNLNSVRQPFRFSPTQLFEHDVLTSCDTAVTRTVQLKGLDCNMPSIVSDTIVGLNSAQYTIRAAPSGTVSGNDSFTISFVAHSAVTYFDTLVVTLDNGLVVRLPLLGTATQPKHIISASVTTLFESDTLSACDSLVFRSFIVRDSGCVHRRVLSESIIGAGLHYEVTAALPSELTGGNDSTELSFTASQPGFYPATLRIVLDDSTIISIPLEGNGTTPKRSLSYDPKILFAQDTLGACDSAALGEVIILSPSATELCFPYRVLSEVLIGPDSSAYRIVGALPSTLTGRDTVSILFSPTQARNYNATFVVTLDDSEKITVQLEGVGKSGAAKLFVSTMNLFASDTLTGCVSNIERGFFIRDSTCAPHRILSEKLLGADSIQYEIVNAGETQLGLFEDTIQVLFSARNARGYHGMLLITLDDSSQIRIQLYGAATSTSYPLIVSPDSLFTSDTIWSCGQAVLGSFVLRDTSCPAREVISDVIVGPDAAHYDILLHLLPHQSLALGDSTQISFQPDSAYNNVAFDKIDFTDGTSVLLPLGGRGRDPIVASIASQSVEEDTIGAVVSLPIILGLSGDLYTSFGQLSANFPSFNFVVHYDTSMFVYKGTVLKPSNLPGDIPGQFWLGRSAIAVNTTVVPSDSILGYVNLEVFPTYNRCANVSFDSIEFDDGAQNCSVFDGHSVTSTVCSVITCGTSILSKFLRYNTTADLTLRPNPASDHLELTSTESLGEVRISFVDALGVVRAQTTASLLAGQPMSIPTPPIAGVYFLLVENNQLRLGGRVVVIR